LRLAGLPDKNVAIDKFNYMNNDISHACQSKLSTLLTLIKNRICHWNALPSAIQRAVSQAQEIAQQTTDEPEIRIAKELIDCLTPFSAYKVLPFHETQNLSKAGRRLQVYARNVNSHALSQLLHSTIIQHMHLAELDMRNLSVGLSEAVTALNVTQKDLECLNRAAKQCENEPSLSAYEQLAKALELLLDALGPLKTPQLSAHANQKRTNYFQIAIIEDEATWRENFIVPAVETLKRELEGLVQIDIQQYQSLEEVSQNLLPEIQHQPNHNKKNPNKQTIAILDLGLPMTRADKNVDREHGYALLKEFRAYRVNIPVIVLTSPDNTLETAKRICGQGIEDCQYMIKGGDDLDLINQLITELKKIITRSQAHRIEIKDLSDNYPVIINGVPIKLEPLWGRLFFSLCDLSRQEDGYFSLARIREFSDYSPSKNTFSDPLSSIEAFETEALNRLKRHGFSNSDQIRLDYSNIMRLWSHIKEAQETDNLSTLAYFKTHQTRLYQSGVEFIKIILDKKCLNTREEAEHFDRLFYFELYEMQSKNDAALEKKLIDIQKRISDILSRVQETFNLVHRFIEPRGQILDKKEIEPGKCGYRVFGNIIFESDFESEDDINEEKQQNIKQAFKSILVIENEPIDQKHICEQLTDIGFCVLTAHSVEETIVRLQENKLDIVTLDLQIPLCKNTEPVMYGGQKVLEYIASQSNLNQHLKIIVASNYANIDEIRSIVNRLGVSNLDVIHKGENKTNIPWEAHLILSVLKARNELRDQTIIPPSHTIGLSEVLDWIKPNVQLIKAEGDPKNKFRLFLNVNGQNISLINRQAALIYYLLTSDNHTLSRSQLIDLLYQGSNNKNPAEALTGLIKQLRKKIIQDSWLPELPKKILNQHQSFSRLILQEEEGLVRLALQS